MFLSSELSYQWAFPNTKSSQWSVIFFFFLITKSWHLLLFIWSIELFILKTKVGRWSCCYGIYQLISPWLKLFMYLTLIKGILSVIGISKAVLTCKVRLIGRFLFLQLSVFYTFNLTFKACLISVCLHSQLCLIPTALTARFVKDEVIWFFPCCVKLVLTSCRTYRACSVH